MKVNMSVLADDEGEARQPVVYPDTNEKDMPAEDTDTDEEEDEEDDDESDSHSKLKTVLLVAAMVGGFALFVWNMTGLVNNMRLDNQGTATNIVYDIEDMSSMMDLSGSGSVPVDPAIQESEVSTDAARDGPASAMAAEQDEEQQDTGRDNADESELQELYDEMANSKALTERELEQAAEMLDASLTREEFLQKLLDEAGIDWRAAMQQQN